MIYELFYDIIIILFILILIKYMDINIKHNLNQTISNSTFIKRLGGTLEKMKYFSVDRTEGKYTILQNLSTQKMHEVKTSSLPPILNDGDILKKVGFSYEFDFQKTREIQRNMQQKMNELRSPENF